MAEGVARLWAGDYVGRPVEGGPSALVRMQVRLEGVEAGGAVLGMVQSGVDGPRRFRLELQPTRLATRLSGSFAPLDAAGRPLGSCPLSVSVRSSGFVASTSAESCRFETDGRSVGLVKEIAHDGSRMIIADRVVEAPGGSGLQPDRFIEFQRVRAFEGQIGVRDGTDGAWRVGRPFELRSDGVGREPSDAGDMPLGVRVELAPYVARDGAATALRLRVFDADSGDLIGQAWADPAAAQLGIALPTVQVALRSAVAAD